MLVATIIFADNATTEKNIALFNAAQKKQLETIIHDYLVNNPKILMEMSQSLQKMQEHEVTKAQDISKKLILEHKHEIFTHGKHQFSGNRNAKVVLVDFFDYQCSHCRALIPTFNKLLAENPNLKIIWIDWPIFGETSVYASSAAHAAKIQGKYEAMHHALFGLNEAITKKKILEIATTIGLDQKQFEEDIESPEMIKFLEANMKLANELKLVAAPTMIVSKPEKDKFTLIVGEVSYLELEKAINDINK